MRTLKESILSSTKTGKAALFTPNTKEELIEMIKNEIMEKGLNCDLNHIKTHKITDMSNLFYLSHFNGDISKWDVSNVRYMNDAFKNSRFDGDLSRWNVSEVRNMNNMFDNSKFTGKNGSINDWDVSKVKLMEQMFRNSDFVGDISSWKIDTYTFTGGMFKNCDIPNKNKPKKNGKTIK